MFFWLFRLPEDGLEHGLKHLLVAGRWPWARFRHLPAAGRFRLFGLFGRLVNSLSHDTKDIRGTRNTLQSLVILDAVFILHACVASGRQRFSRNYTGEK